MEDFLNLTTPAPLALDTLAVNLLLAILFSTLVAVFYTYYGRSLSNRARFAQTLPVLSLITVLVISIVKSSLALSLGLVGALSIVRFRTAIKEPEELIYLFLSLAVGLGLGADQRAATAVALLIIMGYLLARVWIGSETQKNNLYVNISTAVSDGEEKTFTAVNQILVRHVQQAELRRLDSSADSVHLTYLVPPPDAETMTALLDDLRQHLPQGEFTFIEQDNTLAG